MRSLKLSLCLAALAGLAPLAGAQTPAGSAFTYQGRLDDSGGPANGLYDFQFWLANAQSGGGYVGFAQSVEDVSVVNGLFTTKVNFGGINFNGDARFVEVRVRPGASTGAYTALSPRQELTPAPYALGLALPMQEAQTSSSALMWLDQNGTGNCVALTGTNGDCLNVGTDGAGDAVVAHTSGAQANALFAYTTGPGSTAVYGQTNNGGIPIYGYNLGTSGNTGFFRAENQTNPGNCVEIQQNGTGYGLHVNARTNRAGFFENTNASSGGTTLMAQTNGLAPAIAGTTTGANGAGMFNVSNPANSHSALEATTNGTGPAARFNGANALEVNGNATANGNATVNGDVTVNGTLRAEIGGALSRATPIAWGRFTINSNHNPTLLNSSGNVTVNWISGAGYRVHVSGYSGGAGYWVPVGQFIYAGVAPEHSYFLRVSPPTTNGDIDFWGSCSGCIIPNFDGDDLQIAFVIYG